MYEAEGNHTKQASTKSADEKVRNSNRSEMGSKEKGTMPTQTKQFKKSRGE